MRFEIGHVMRAHWFRYLSPFGSTSVIAALNRPSAAWNFFFLPFAYADRSFFASLTMRFTIAFFAFGSALCASPSFAPAAGQFRDAVIVPARR
jgi:hypothetical protein